MAYQIIFEKEASGNLGKMNARERSIILDAIEKQLVDQPGISTRNRKRLRPNPLAKWELRAGNLRVFYDIDELVKEVVILNVGRKTGNRLIVGEKEYHL